MIMIIVVGIIATIIIVTTTVIMALLYYCMKEYFQALRRDLKAEWLKCLFQLVKYAFLSTNSFRLCQTF